MSEGIPPEVMWSAAVSGLVLVIGSIRILVGGEGRAVDKLILFGTVCYAAPLAGFGTEHFTLTRAIASIVPSWIPWHDFWAYLVGACFIAAGLSMAAGVLARWAASAVAATFLLFVIVMDLPAWARAPNNDFAVTLALRELSFSGGALALAATSMRGRTGPANTLAAIARYAIAIGLVWFSFEQFRRGDHVPALPLPRVTPSYVVGGAVWTSLCAAIYAVGGVCLLAAWRPRAAAIALGATVLVVVLVVYVPIGVVDRARLDQGYNYVADTLMYGGALLMLAGAMPRQRQPDATAADRDTSGPP